MKYKINVIENFLEKPAFRLLHGLRSWLDAGEVIPEE
jgi:hypothetical protein